VFRRAQGVCRSVGGVPLGWRRRRSELKELQGNRTRPRRLPGAAALVGHDAAVRVSAPTLGGSYSV
jgi:hypothetical protein